MISFNSSVALLDEERLWSRVLELGEELDRAEEDDHSEGFVWGDLYEDQRI